MKRTCHLLGVLGLALTSGDALAAAAPPEGRKIEFTAPREPAPVRPMSGSEVRNLQSGFQRRESSSVMSDVPLAAMPSSEDVDRRTRVLLELIELRAGRLRDDVEGSGVSLDDPTAEEGLAGPLGIDELRTRQSRRGDRRGRESEGETENSSRSEPKRGDDLGHERDPSKAGDQDWAGANRARADSDDRNRRRDEAFLPGMGGPGFLEGDLDLSRGSENLADSGRFLSRSGFSPDSGENARLRSQERMDAFRKLLPQNSRLDGLNGGRAGSAGGRPGDPMVQGLTSGGPGGGRTISDVLGSAPGAGPNEAPVADRSFAMPSRPAELDLGVGRAAARNSADLAAPAASPRPMELFQRKHDTRLPTRGF